MNVYRAIAPVDSGSDELGETKLRWTFFGEGMEDAGEQAVDWLLHTDEELTGEVRIEMIAEDAAEWFDRHANATEIRFGVTDPFYGPDPKGSTPETTAEPGWM